MTSTGTGAVTWVKFQEEPKFHACRRELTTQRLIPLCNATTKGKAVTSLESVSRSKACVKCSARVNALPRSENQ